MVIEQNIGTLGSPQNTTLERVVIRHDEEIKELQAGGLVPADDSISNAKLGLDVKVGSLALLNTSVKTDVVSSINEVLAGAGGSGEINTKTYSINNQAEWDLAIVETGVKHKIFEIDTDLGYATIATFLGGTIYNQSITIDLNTKFIALNVSLVDSVINIKNGTIETPTGAGAFYVAKTRSTIIFDTVNIEPADVAGATVNPQYVVFMADAIVDLNLKDTVVSTLNIVGHATDLFLTGGNTGFVNVLAEYNQVDSLFNGNAVLTDSSIQNNMSGASSNIYEFDTDVSTTADLTSLPLGNYTCEIENKNLTADYFANITVDAGKLDLQNGTYVSDPTVRIPYINTTKSIAGDTTFSTKLLLTSTFAFFSMTWLSTATTAGNGTSSVAVKTNRVLAGFPIGLIVRFIKEG